MLHFSVVEFHLQAIWLPGKPEWVLCVAFFDWKLYLAEAYVNLFPVCVYNEHGLCTTEVKALCAWQFDRNLFDLQTVLYKIRSLHWHIWHARVHIGRSLATVLRLNASFAKSPNCAMPDLVASP
jgi:hypothetical protein